MSEFLKIVKNSIKHWYILLFVGILFMVIGVYTINSPLDAYLTLAIIFAFAFMLSGISEVLFSISNRKEIDNWGWTLIFGLVTFVIGMHLISSPGITMLTLPLIVGFVLLFRSIAAISFSLDLRNYKVKEWGFLMILGALGAIFSFFILWHPIAGGLAVTIWIGLTLIMNGIFSVYLSLKLRHLKKLPGKVSDELKQKFESIQQELATKAAQ